MSNLHKEHRRRIREEFRGNGMRHSHPHKSIEHLLFHAIPLRDTNELAHRLLEGCGSYSGIFDAPYDVLCGIEGMGPETATYIKLVSRVIQEYMDDHAAQNNRLTDPAAAKEFMRFKFLGQQVETIYLTGLGHNMRVLFFTALEEGSPESVEVTPAKLVRTALRADVSKVILSHNHPSGICNPSNRDLYTTKLLYDELKRVEVELLDHIVVATDGACSMRELGMIPGKAASSGPYLTER